MTTIKYETRRIDCTGSKEHIIGANKLNFNFGKNMYLCIGDEEASLNKSTYQSDLKLFQNKKLVRTQNLRVPHIRYLKQSMVKLFKM